MRSVPGPALALLALLLFGPDEARAQNVPPQLQGELYAKVLTFDRAQESRAADGLVVGVLFQRGYRTSREARDAFVAGFTSASANAAGVRFVDIDHAGNGSLLAALGAQRIDVLYVAPLRSADLAAVVEASRAHGVLTLAGDPAHMRAGLAVGTRLRGDRPVMLVNTVAAQAEGAAFSAQLLRMAELVR